MNRKLPGYLMLALSSLLYLIGAACIVATVHALTVRTTLAAIESAFGTLVIAILILLLARKAWHGARSRLQAAE